MSKKQKLELTWIGKGDEPVLEPRILIEDPTRSYGIAETENMLIHGDNLLALKALEQDYAGRIKSIYIDPPYNTGNAFEHYDDGLEHSIWLDLISQRLSILHNLLSDDGSIWISIDDDESHYLKILCDEIFGRSNFVNNVVWEKKYSPSNDAKWLSDSHDHILVYAKNKSMWRPNLLPRTDEMNARYKNPDNDTRGRWKSGDLLRKDAQKTGLYTITTPSGRVCNPPSGRSWRVPEYKYIEMVKEDRIWFGAKGDAIPSIKRFLSDVQDGSVAKTIWLHSDVGHNDQAQKEMRSLFPDDPFSTPKPEKLIERILNLSTKPGDLVLDSFVGSGTTSAVAHKMGRSWIGIELGQHAYTHCVPRLHQVIDGIDQGGISKALEWKGGGGFKFYELATSLLAQDEHGNWVISKDYDANMLAHAMAKQEGFTYDPSQSTYWKQGSSTENDYIFTTTQHVTVELLDAIHNVMQNGESLLIACKAFDNTCKDRYDNITIKKIPHILLGRCEFGKDDYSFNITEGTETSIDEGEDE
jgi:adenine-specific DNA-methyltransferase